MDVTLHPQAQRLENCLDALKTNNRRKVSTSIHLVRQLADYLAGHWPKPGREYGQKRISVNTRHLPRGASYVAVEFQPFKIAQEDPQRRPWYVMHLERPWLGREDAMPKTKEAARAQIARVFAPLIRKHKLRIQQPASDHWNLVNKAGTKTVAVSVMNGKLLLVADQPEQLLEMAEHYFRDAQPIDVTKSKSRDARVAAPMIQITERIERRRAVRPKPDFGQLEFDVDGKVA